MPKLILLILLLPLAASALAQGREVTLAELVAALQRDGYSVLYSNSVVSPAQTLHVEHFDLQSLEDALAELGLRLQARDGVWVIVRSEETPTAEPVAEPPVIEETILEMVIVTGSLHHFPQVGPTSSTYSLTAADMSVVPSLGSDAMRATLRLPGISSVGVSAKPQIRGGLKDELLVMQDGVELLEPFHLADYHSAYSSIDYHTIESMDVYTGGFPSRYGNRMSGVMDIQNRWQDDEYDTDIGVSSFANFIHTRGQFGQQRPTDWSLSLRQGDLTDLADYIQTRSGDPKYADASARMNIELSAGLELAFGAVYTEDDIEFADAEESASSQIESGYLWAGLDWRASDKLRGRFTASWLDFQREKEQRSMEETDQQEDEQKGGSLEHRQEVERLALRNDWTALRGDTLLEFGWQAEYSRGDYRHVSRIDRGELADILDTEREIDRDIELEPDGWSGGAYLQAEWDLSPRLTIQPSLRWDTQDYYLQRNARHQFSPRLGFAWEIDGDTRARLSLGRFHQPEGIHELQVLDGVSRYYVPQHSDQAVAGIEWRHDKLALTAEVYYKRYGDQKGRFENVFNPFVLLPEMEPDRVGLAPGKALARGFDLDGNLQFRESVSGHLRYSYMDARDRIDGRWIDRRWSQRHTVNTGLVWQQDSFSLSLAVTWHSGWRSTRLPAFVAEDELIPVASVLNNTELREYISLDIGARKSWEIGRTRLQVYADISNLTDRSNRAGIDFDVEEVEGGYELLPDHETLLGRVPSVGVILSF